MTPADPARLDLSKELDFARSLMAGCARITRSVQEQHVTAHDKSDHSPVTIADFAVQAYVAQAIHAHFPADALVGEENSAALRQQPDLLEGVTNHVRTLIPAAAPPQVRDWIDLGAADPALHSRFWVIDPVDGTKGFLRRMHYATALALIIDGRVALGVVSCPQLSLHKFSGGIAYAAAGQGAFWQPFNAPGQPIPLRVSPQSSLSDARILRSFEDSHTNTLKIEQFAAHSGITADPIRMDSQAKYVLLAAGQADLLLRLPTPQKPNFREYIWDQAPAYRIIIEAGGQMTDALGLPLDFSAGLQLTHNHGIVATNGALHAQTLHILAKIMP